MKMNDNLHSSASWFSAWADIPSGLLLAVLLLSGGATPQRYVWGRSRVQSFFFLTALFASILFTIVRFILEGVWRDPGPREFMVISIVYSVRWILLWIHMTIPGLQHAKLLQVAQVLRDIKMIRHGQSRSRWRQGERELVVRRGVSTLGTDGIRYWRGVEEKTEKLPNGLWIIRLMEAHLHADFMDAWGTSNYFDDGPPKEDIFARTYGVAISAFRTDIVTDLSPFLTRIEACRLLIRRFKLGKRNLATKRRLHGRSRQMQ